MQEKKDSFVFYRSFFEAIKDLPDKEQLELYKAICNLALDEVETELNGITSTLFKLIRPNIIANTEKWRNGNKGGRPKKEKKPVDKNKKTSGFENKKPNVNVNDDVNVDENEKKDVNENINVDEKKSKKIDPYFSPIKNKFLKEYEKIFNKKGYLGNSHILKLAQLSDEIEDLENKIPEILHKLKQIDWDIDFTPDINWLLKDDNLISILNGEYDKKSSKENNVDKSKLIEMARSI